MYDRSLFAYVLFNHLDQLASLVRLQLPVLAGRKYQNSLLSWSREVSVLTVLEHAKLADKPSDPAASPAPGQLLLGRDDVIEIAASDPRGVTAVALQGEASGHAELLDAAPDRNGAAREASSDHADASPESNDGADGERTIFDNGAEVIYDAVLDSGGELHGYRRSRALAETFAATLPGPTAMTAVGQKRT